MVAVSISRRQSPRTRALLADQEIMVVETTVAAAEGILSKVAVVASTTIMVAT